MSTRFQSFSIRYLSSKHGDFTEYIVEKATLESVFIKVIRENNVKEEQEVLVLLR